MPDPFATAEDLELRWRALSSEEETKATLLLDDASALIRAECRAAHRDIDAALAAGALDPQVPLAVVCAVVKRAMQATVFDGVAEQQQTAGPFGISSKFTNPTGDLYLTRSEKRRLGIPRQRAFTIDPSQRAE